MNTDIAIAVPTRNRPDALGACVRALVDHEPGTSILIVDQSDAPQQDSDWLGSQHVRHVRSSAQGVSRARNLALQLCESDVLVFVDDDCTVQPGVVDAMRAVFDDPSVGVAFGTVTPAPHNAQRGYIVGFEPAQFRVFRRPMAKVQDAGIGACMGVRVAAGRETPFDETLGPGATFPSCEEGDLALRMLQAGWAVAHVPDAQVVHHGLRPHSDGRAAARETWRGIAAAYLKHVRSGSPAGVVVYGCEFWRVAWGVSSRIITLRRPFGVARLQGFLQGSLLAATFPLDRCRCLYETEPRSPIGVIQPTNPQD